MGDSDDEFDRRGRGRDKFRGERNDFQRDNRNRGGGGGWEDNKNWGGGRDRNFRGDYDRKRYSPQRHDGSPPQKRMRADWDEGSGRYNNHEGGGAGPGDAPAASNSYNAGAAATKGGDNDYPTQPAMLAFKAFLSQQDDNISDDDAIKKYNEYKFDFKKQQINEFFLAHKEEEWFRAKYHPEEVAKRKEWTTAALNARLNAFTKILEMGWLDGPVSVDVEKSDDIVKMLDAAVILMEGGDDFDLKVLNPEEMAALQKERAKERAEKQLEAKKDIPVTVTFNNEEEKKDAAPEIKVEVESEQKEIKVENEKKEETEPKENGNGKVKEESEPEKKEEVKEPEPPKEPLKPKKKRRRDSNDSWSSSDSDGSLSTTDSENEDKNKEKENKEVKEEDKDEEEEEDEEEEDSEDEDDLDLGPMPKALHKTQSIFLRNLDPSITKLEVESMCKKYPGFLRVGLQDPLPERRFFRRGWVTFDRTVNIKDICWNLNNIRLRDCDMGAIVNRELKQRVRPIIGILCHKPVFKADIKHAAKIIQNLDKRSGLWQGEKKDEEKKKSKEKKPAYGMSSRNPMLKNITDYLVDEGSYEEEAYLGALAGDEASNPTEQTIERDEETLKVLDKMILYLRIVHSFDYYTAVEYPCEDEMPHRCGIMHGRGLAPKTCSESEINDYNTKFEAKVKNFVNLKLCLTKEEAVRLGRKKEEEEIEKFLQANTQELGKDKWLCPLSGKKFKGPEFIRKHILNKHNDKVEEQKLEVEYFNNFLIDPKRPQLPEHPSMKTRPPNPPPASPQNSGGDGYQGGYQDRGGYQGGGGGYQGGGFNRSHMGGMYHQGNQRGNWRGGGGGYRGGGYNRRGGFNNYSSPNYQGGNRDNYRRDNSRDRGMPPPRRDRSRSDPRGIIEYRDLDAPEDSENF